MNRAAKNLFRVAGVVAGLGAAAWALRDRMIRLPEVPDGEPAAFRTGQGADDLTEINGIGPVYRDRLAAADIFTFSELALRTTEEISELVGTSHSVAQKWVQTARAMA